MKRLSDPCFREAAWIVRAHSTLLVRLSTNVRTSILPSLIGEFDQFTYASSSPLRSKCSFHWLSSQSSPVMTLATLCTVFPPSRTSCMKNPPGPVHTYCLCSTSLKYFERMLFVLSMVTKALQSQKPAEVDFRAACSEPSIWCVHGHGSHLRQSLYLLRTEIRPQIKEVALRSSYLLSLSVSCQYAPFLLEHFSEVQKFAEKRSAVNDLPLLV